jgi:hypothetical protein
MEKNAWIGSTVQNWYWYMERSEVPAGHHKNGESAAGSLAGNGWKVKVYR